VTEPPGATVTTLLDTSPIPEELLHVLPIPMATHVQAPKPDVDPVSAMLKDSDISDALLLVMVTT
jgi:hypothetical protein